MSQMRLGSGIAVAVAQTSSYSSDSTPSLEPPYAAGVALKKKDKKKNLVGNTICYHLDIKYDTNEPTYETETVTDIENKRMVTKEERSREG